MGGTGAMAKGTGIGGTGIKLGVYINEMQLAGNVIASQGTVEAESKGSSRSLANGDPVCVGDTITTSQSASAQIRMADGGLVAIRPQTQLKIEKFAYRGSSKDNSLLLLTRGACRIVTGNIGKQYPENDLLKTPAATIGVREADHEVAVISPGKGGSYPSGTYDKVNHGTTFLRTDKGKLAIRPDEAGFAADTGEMPTLLRAIPDFYNAAGSMEHEFPGSEGKK